MYLPEWTVATFSVCILHRAGLQPMKPWIKCDIPISCPHMEIRSSIDACGTQTLRPQWSKPIPVLRPFGAAAHTYIAYTGEYPYRCTPSSQTPIQAQKLEVTDSCLVSRNMPTKITFRTFRKQWSRWSLKSQHRYVENWSAHLVIICINSSLELPMFECLQ